jgi:tRNA G18 (ribose-2'-O)-methylase SpoU
MVQTFTGAHHGKRPRTEERFLAEGSRVVQEMLDNHADLLIGIYTTEESRTDPLVEKANSANIKVHTHCGTNEKISSQLQDKVSLRSAALPVPN